MCFYEYHEFGSKNRQGGFNNLNVENKVVRQFENVSGSGICHVRILDKYLEKIPPVAKEADVFYLTRMCKITDLCRCTTTFGPLLPTSMSLSESHALLYSLVDAILVIVQSHFLEILLLVVKRMVITMLI